MKITPIVTINYLAVLAAALVNIVLGFLWYGPLFGKYWIKLMNFDKKKMEEAKKKGMAKTYAVMVVSTLLMSYILAHFVDYAQATTLIDGIIAGFWIWLGFVATIMIGTVLWEGKPMKLYLLNISYYLVALSIMGAILAVWA